MAKTIEEWLEPTSKQIVLMAGAILQQPLGTADNRHPDWETAVQKSENAYSAMRSAVSEQFLDVLKDAARYRWLFGARTAAQVETVSGTVCNPLPQDEIIAELQGFYLHKEMVDTLVDHCMAAQENKDEKICGK